MSQLSTGVNQPALLPPTLEARFVGLVLKIFGLALLAASSAVGLALLTWSASDPSLTHATSGQTRNLLGPFGAIISDLLMQTLGVAGAVALLPLIFWSLTLITRRRVAGIRHKFLLAPVGVLLLAGALSALPKPASWPLLHGFGGVLGDLVLRLTTSAFSPINAERASLAAGLVLSAGGLTILTVALGLSHGDVVTVLTRRDRQPAGRRRWFARARRAESQAPSLSIDPFGDGEPGFGDQRAGPAGMRVPAARTRASVMSPADEPHAHLHERAAPAATDPLRRGSFFDDHTDIESRAMAARFAPLAAEPLHASPIARPASVASSGFFAGIGRAAGLRKQAPEHRLPGVNMLKRAAAERPDSALSQSVLKGQARLLEDTLADFGVKGEIKDIKPGPVVTLFELEPARGTKSSRVIGLADDIARSMSAHAVRVAVVPGRNVIGIELPNPRREMVYLRELIESPAFRSSDAKLPMILGKTIGGEPIIADLARMPHLLVAGTTGSGKSVGVNAMILSLLYRLSPDECRMIMIDPKMLELSVYNGIPHLLTPVVTDPNKAIAALNWVVTEMEERYKRMSKLAVRNIDVFNNRVRNATKRGEALSRTVQTGFNHKTGEAIYEHEGLELKPMPYIVVVVDEFADLMAVAGKEIEFAVQRLAQMARAAGIHLIMATQRPSVDIITGTIKANFPTRISFKVTSKIDSRTILNEQGAEQLLGQGDMLYAGGASQVLRVHGPFVSDEEVEAIAGFLREQGEPRYVQGLTDAGEPAEAPECDPRGRLSEDELYDRAVAIVLADKRASTSYIQRRLSIGYNRAADLIERMEQDGIVGQPNPSGKRMVLSADRAAEPAVSDRRPGYPATHHA